MAFPASTVSVPSLSSYQIWFAGTTWGPNTALEFLKIEGLDQPDVRTGDGARARDHGMFAGLDVMAGRTITFTAQLQAQGSTAFQTQWIDLAGATVPGGYTELPLFVNLPGFGTLVSMCRVRKRSMPIDIPFALGNFANVTLQLYATDPRLYSTPTTVVTVSPPGTGNGFAFPLTFPLSFGGGSVAGSISYTNFGDIDVRPMLTVTGPCTNPSITLASASNSPVLQFNLTMNSGDTLVIDTDFHTATYYTAGSTIGSTRLASLVQGSTWFTLPPGASTLQFLTGDPVATGSLTLTAPQAAYIL